MKPNIDKVATNGDDTTSAKIGGQNNVIKSSGHERKRTANLESLIGNLKVRKMNVKSEYESSASGGSGGSSGKKLNSIYVEVTNNSLSDCCSRSTPPLSSSSPSSSVSPTSSMSPDSPIQSNASSSFSSLSSSSNNASLNSTSTSKGVNKSSTNASAAAATAGRLLPKYEWLGLNKTTGLENNNNTTCNNRSIKKEKDDSVGEVEEDYEEMEQPVDLIKEEETDTIKEPMMVGGWTIKSEDMEDNEASGESDNDEDIDEDEDLLQHSRQGGQTSQVMSLSSSSSTASVSKPSGGKKAAAKHVNKNHFNYKIVHADGGKNGDETGGRAVKFYDDFIDFRGDILRRPPNSKNCRILWEYLFLLLQDSNYSSVIKWEDESNMVFRIVQAEKLAALWGLQKNRLGMTYEKLSRGMRYYYPNNIIAREPGRRLLYRFMRHPDDIKKFVKKNGTYMLKKSKSGGSSKGGLNPDEMGSPSDDLDDSMNTAELNPDDSGVDEPFNTMNKVKKQQTTATMASKNARRKQADDENNDATSNNQDTENNVFSITKNKSFSNDNDNTRNHLKVNNSFLSQQQQQQQQQQASSNPLGSIYNDLYLYSAQMAAATYLQNLMSNSGKVDDVNNSLLMQQLRNNTSNMNEIANQNLLENNAKFPNLNEQVLMYLKYFNNNNNNNSTQNNNNKSPSTSSYSSTHSSSSSDNNSNSINYASKKFNTNHHQTSSSSNFGGIDHPLNLTMSNKPPSSSLLMKKAKK